MKLFKCIFLLAPFFLLLLISCNRGTGRTQSGTQPQTPPPGTGPTTTTTPNGPKGPAAPPPQPPGGRRAVPPPQPSGAPLEYAPYFKNVCEYRYQPGKGGVYLQMLKDYFKDRRLDEGRKRSRKTQAQRKWALLHRYQGLWKEHYEKAIANTHLQIFQGNLIKDQEIKNLKLETKGNPKLENDMGVYQYRNGEAYVDFAAKRIGGGALSIGFVQEEIEMLESTFLPWLTQVQNRDNVVSWCKEIPLTSLDTKPVVMRFRMPFKIDTRGIYGKKLGTKHTWEGATKLFTKRDENPDIYSIAMAAANFFDGRNNPPKRYEKKDISQMIYTATRAFLDAMLAMHADKVPIVINTGNWGAGAFKGNVNVVFSMQYFAFLAAYEKFYQLTNKKPAMTYRYHSAERDDRNLYNNMLNSEFSPWLDKLIAANITRVGDLIEKLTTKSNDIKWQTGYDPYDDRN